MLKYIVVFAGASLLAISLPAKAQEQRDIVALSSEEIMTPSDTVPRKKTVIVDGVELNEKQLKRYYRQFHPGPQKHMVVCTGRSFIYTGSFVRCGWCRPCQLPDE